MAELHVMDAFREKRFELSGAVSRLEQRLAQHRGSVLRDAPQPLATRELAERVMAARGTPAADKRTRALIQKTVLASLSRAKGTIERTEVAGVVSWRVCQAA